jgi:hypothetical protein
MNQKMKKWLIQDYFRSQCHHSGNYRAAWKNPFLREIRRTQLTVAQLLLTRKDSPISRLYIHAASVPKYPVYFQQDEDTFKAILEGTLRPYSSPSEDQVNPPKGDRRNLHSSASTVSKDQNRPSLFIKSPSPTQKFSEVDTLMGFADDIIQKIHGTIEQADENLDLFQKGYAGHGMIVIPDDFAPNRALHNLYVSQGVVPEVSQSQTKLAARNTLSAQERNGSARNTQRRRNSYKKK